jgi:hypothetical protein
VAYDTELSVARRKNRVDVRQPRPTQERTRRGEKRAFLLNKNSFFKTARRSGRVSVTYSNVSGKRGGETESNFSKESDTVRSEHPVSPQSFAYEGFPSPLSNRFIWKRCNLRIMTLDNIMLDPSLMVSSTNLAATETRLDRLQREYDELEFHISRSFQDFVFRLETEEQLKESALFKFFGGDEPAEIRYLQEFVSDFDENTFGVNREYVYEHEQNTIQLYPEFEENMWYYNRYENPDLLYQTMADEFAFVNNRSILSVDTSKVPERFKEIGAVTIEVGEKVFEKMVSGTLNLDEDEEEILTKSNIARTDGEYALIGGSTLSSQFTGFLSTVVIPTSFGIILSIDPETEPDSLEI